MISILFFPFTIIGTVLSAVFSFFGLLFGLVFGLLGRFLSLGLGVVFCAIGIISAITLVGTFIGVPLLIFGGAMVLRSVCI